MSQIVKQADLELIRTRFEKLTSKEVFEKEASFAMQLISRNKQLEKCTKESLLGAVFNVALFGLSLNPVKKEAYIVPRYDRNNGMTAYLEPSYMGLIKAVTQAGAVAAIEAHAVYKGDDFEYELGLNPILKHRPKKASKEILFAYAVATLPSGLKQIEVMGIDELHEIRNTSTSYQAMKQGKISSCIWVDFEGEMCRKTVVRRIVKYLPKGDNDRLQDLTALDETDYTPSFSEITYAEQLVNTSTYDDEEKARIERVIETANKPELTNIIIDLQNNQLPITELNAPTQKELANAIKDKE